MLNPYTLYSDLSDDLNEGASNRCYHKIVMKALQKDLSKTAVAYIDMLTNINYTDKYSILGMAVNKNNIGAVTALIGKGADINLAGLNKNTPLIIAVQNQNIDIIKLLIEKGADINLPGADADTPLISAVQNGYTDIISLLIDRGADVNLAGEDAYTPLAVAISENHTDIAKLLIDRGADINSISANETPLIMAARLKNTDVAKLLIEKGADRNLVDDKCNSALIYAVKTENIDLVKLLVENGSDCNLVNIRKSSALSIAVAKNYVAVATLLIEADANITMPNNESLLKLALDKNHVEIANKMVIKGITTIDSTLALYWAVEQKNIDLLKLLCSKGADLNVALNQSENLLTLALRSSNTEILQTLIKNGIDLNAVDANADIRIPAVNNYSPLMYLLKMYNRHNKLDMVKMLVKGGANVNAVHDNKNALWVALRYINSDNAICKYIAKRTTFFDGIEYNGRSIFQHVVNYNYTSIVKWMVRNGANTDTGDIILSAEMKKIIKKELKKREAVVAKKLLTNSECVGSDNKHYPRLDKSDPIEMVYQRKYQIESQIVDIVDDKVSVKVWIDNNWCDKTISLPNTEIKIPTESQLSKLEYHLMTDNNSTETYVKFSPETMINSGGNNVKLGNIYRNPY